MKSVVLFFLPQKQGKGNKSVSSIPKHVESFMIWLFALFCSEHYKLLNFWKIIWFKYEQYICCCRKLIDKSNVWKDEFILAYSLRGHSQSYNEKDNGRNVRSQRTLCVPSNRRERGIFVLSSCFLL